jgi:hypothetical protein
MFIKTTLGEVESEILRKYRLPFGCKIRFESGNRAIRSDKEITWWPIPWTRPRSSFGDMTLKAFTDSIGKRVDGLKYDDIVVIGPTKEKIEKQTLLKNVQKMAGILTPEEEKAEGIFETSRRRIQSQVRFHPNDVSVLKILIDVLIDIYSIEAVEEVVSGFRNEIDEVE